MKGIDIEEKLLTDYNDVFADIVNVLLFQGKQKVKECELVNVKDRSRYKADGMTHEQERDLSKVWERGGVRLSFLGIENQTREDKDMPLRVIGYDGAAYRSQCAGSEKERYPVVTLVLHFGIKHRWCTPKCLYERINVPEDMRPYVSNYRMNVFDIAFLTQEEVSLFQSDFGVVADYFVQMQRTGDYKPSPQKLVHVDEILKLFSVLTGDDRFREAQFEEKGGRISMCEVLDRVEQRGIEKGIESMRATLDKVEQRGIEKGIESMRMTLDKVEQRGIEKGIESMRATLDRVEQMGIEKGIESMRTSLDRVEQRGIEKGIESMRTTLDRVEQRGIEKGIEKGLEALVNALKGILPSFNDVYETVIGTEAYANVTKEQVEKWYAQ